jgi:hypothetical protein
VKQKKGGKIRTGRQQEVEDEKNTRNVEDKQTTVG